MVCDPIPHLKVGQSCSAHVDNLLIDPTYSLTLCYVHVGYVEYVGQCDLRVEVQLISSAFELRIIMGKGKYMVCTAHRLQCKILHFPKHIFPMYTTLGCSNAPEINCS